MLVVESQTICQRFEKYTPGCFQEEEIGHPSMEVTYRKEITVLGRVKNVTCWEKQDLADCSV